MNACLWDELEQAKKGLLNCAQGTASSKKKKQAKLKRVMHTVKKQARRERADGAEGFAAIQLLHDPQVGATILPA